MTVLKDLKMLESYAPVIFCLFGEMPHECVFVSDVTCEEGAVHLVGGDAESIGRVIYCYNGSWHSVCADGWDPVEAEVTCYGLGYNALALALCKSFPY